MIDTKKIISTYDNIAIDYDKKYSAPSGRIKTLLRYLAPKSHVLDVGCGAGNNAIFLAKRGYCVVGIDLSENMLTCAKSKDSNIEFIKMDIHKIRFDAATFDCAIASYSLCHLNKAYIASCLRQISKVLKNKGVLFLELYTGKSAEITIKEPLNTNLTMDLSITSDIDIKRMLCQGSFEVAREFHKQDHEFGLNGLKDTCIIAKKI